MSPVSGLMEDVGGGGLHVGTETGLLMPWVITSVARLVINGGLLQKKIFNKLLLDMIYRIKRLVEAKDKTTQMAQKTIMCI